MADIAMCRGENCEQREQCYRYTAPIAEDRQTVFTHTPPHPPCFHFLDNTGRIDGRKIGQWWKFDEFNINELDSNALKTS